MRHLVLCLALLFQGALAGAAADPGSRAEPASKPAASYTYMPGDLLEITVSSHTGLDRTITIQPDGRIQFPLAGEIVAAGLTATQLAGRLQEGLSRELVDPHVTVSLKEMNHSNRRVSVLGAVHSPGVYDLKAKGTLTELLATAGGPQPLADLSRITITDADRSRVQTVDLLRATQGQQTEGDRMLEPGDLIIVPAGAAPTALVMGQVTRPGSYQIQERSRVMDLLSQAGGSLARADLSRVKLTRAGQDQFLDLQAVSTGSARADSEANPPVQSGDTIVVPENTNAVYLLGEVAKPDAYPLRGGDHLLDLLTRAGGTSPQADADKAVLLRRDPRGQPVAQPLRLGRLLTKGEMRDNLVLQPGDVIVVPGKKVKNGSGMTTLLSPVLGLLSLLRAGFTGF
jgi:polysaccharide export outer membrane protein